MEPLAGTAVVAIFAGVVLLIVGLAIFRRKRSFYAGTTKMEGTVIGFRKTEINSADEAVLVEREEDITRGTPHAPRIEYSIGSTEKTYVIEGVASSPPKYKIGEKILLLYHPDKPDKAVVDSFFNKWLSVVVLSTFGVVLLIFGVVLAVVA